MYHQVGNIAKISDTWECQIFNMAAKMAVKFEQIDVTELNDIQDRHIVMLSQISWSKNHMEVISHVVY